MSELGEVLKDWNPWWETGEVPREVKGYTRQITQELTELLKDETHAKAILGPRRSGKTTIMYQLMDKLIKDNVSPDQILYVNFEDPRLDKFTINEIYKEFVRINKPSNSFLFLDEIHQKPEWARWVRTRIDLRSGDNIVVSGSTSHLISQNVAHALGGRVYVKHVYPLSFSEVLNIMGIKPTGERGLATSLGILEDCMKWGCYPAVALEKSEALKMNRLLSYLETIVSRDVSATHNLDFNKAKQIFSYILKNSGDLTSINKLKNVFKVSYETAEKYINAMKDAMVVIESRRYAFSIKEQLAFPRKFYPIDLGLRTVGIPQTHRDTGKLLETFVAQEIVKAGYTPYYLSNGGECDIIVTKNDVPVFALQITSRLSKSNEERETSGLDMAIKKLGVPGRILTMEDATKFLYALGLGKDVFKEATNKTLGE